MARAQTPKRYFLPDFKYNSTKVTRLINYIMEAGKKKVATRIVYSAFELIAEKEKKNPLDLLEAAIHEITPKVEVKSRRVGGANLQIPIEVSPERQQQLWMRWLTQTAKKRSEKTMSQRLACEIMAAAKAEGNAVKRKKNAHKAAESHKAYAHLK